MTLHQLLNACNADPDIEITVFENRTCCPIVFSGKYEDLDHNYYGREVSSFSVYKLNKKPHITLISQMSIFLT